MKEKLKNLLSYIIKTYPYEKDLTISRLTALVYLIDYEHMKTYNTTLTENPYYLNKHGINALDISIQIKNDKDLTIEKTKSNFGTIKFLVKAKNNKTLLTYENLEKDQIKIIDQIIDQTKTLSYNQLMTYVYHTNIN